VASPRRFNAAVVLLLVGGVLEVFGVTSFVIQTISTPGQKFGPLAFVFGPLLFAAGIIQLVVGPTAFRKGSKWAWYIMLVVVIAGVSNVVYDWPYLGAFAVALFPFYGGFALAALLLTYKGSSRRKSSQPPESDCSHALEGSVPGFPRP